MKITNAPKGAECQLLQARAKVKFHFGDRSIKVNANVLISGECFLSPQITPIRPTLQKKWNTRKKPKTQDLIFRELFKLPTSAQVFAPETLSDTESSVRIVRVYVVNSAS